MLGKLGLVLLVTMPCVGAGTSAAAATSDGGDALTELANRYAPYVMLQRQPVPCDHGEPFAPSLVDSILDQPDVVVRDASGNVLIQSPSADDLASAPPDSNIDLPGDAGNPGCDFEQRFGRANTTLPSAMYVRLATDPDVPDQVALQYWLFFVYNDWNNLHEGDWEMAQVVFDATSAESALASGPTGMAISQHNGNERRPWDGVTRQGDRPIIFAAAGSHAIYYSSHRWFGKSGDAGFGCDDTRGPSDRTDPQVILLPDSVTAGDGFAWLTFPGRWGQRAPSLNDSETGPPSTDQWMHPIKWMQTMGRDAAVTVPELGGVTGFFCQLSAAGSKVLNSLLDRPLLVGLLLAVIIGCLVFLIRRTRWSPVVAAPVDMQRSAGQILRSAWKLLRTDRRKFRPISILVILGGLAAALIQFAVTRTSTLDSLLDIVGHDSTIGSAIALLIGTIVTVPIAVIAVGAGLVAVNDAGSTGRGVPFRRLWGSHILLPVVAVFVVVLFGWLLWPLAVYLIARFGVVPGVAAAQGLPARRAIAEAQRLTTGNRIRAAAIAIVAVTIVYFGGLMIGTVVLLLTNASFGAVNLISSLVNSVLLPWLAVVIAMFHADLRIRNAATEQGS